MAEKTPGREIELRRIFDKVDEAIGAGSYSLRRRAGESADPQRWRAVTTFYQEEVQGSGATPGEALICFLMKVLEHEQARGAEHEDSARGARDRIARVQRAIDSL